MNVNEAAKALRVSRWTVYMLIRSGVLKAKKCGMSHRIAVEVNCGHLFTVGALAECLNVSPGLIRKLIYRGAIKSQKIGRQHRIKVSEGVKLITVRTQEEKS